MIPSSELETEITRMREADTVTAQSGFQAQYNVLEQVSPKVGEVVTMTAKKFPLRNRSTEFLPHESWRVCLGECPDYINASFANGYKDPKAYIVAEAPMENTCRMFWKMIHERKCCAVLMLSELSEDDKELCYPYWPCDEPKKYGGLVIEVPEEVQCEGYVERRFTIKEAVSGNLHQVVQFQLSCWSPGDLCTNYAALMNVIEEVGVARRRSGNRPILLHGNDVVTRCGAVCALLNTIECCKTEGIVAVFQMVKALRAQRPGSVTTVDQYTFIFEMMQRYLDTFSIYANFK